MEKCFVVNENGFEIKDFDDSNIDYSKVGYNEKDKVSEVIEMDYCEICWNIDDSVEFDESLIEKMDCEFDDCLNEFFDMYKNKNGKYGIYIGEEFSCIWFIEE